MPGGRTAVVIPALPGHVLQTDIDAGSDIKRRCQPLTGTCQRLHVLQDAFQIRLSGDRKFVGNHGRKTVNDDAQDQR